MPKTTAIYIAQLLDHATRVGLDSEQLRQDAAIPIEYTTGEHRWVDNRYLTSLIKLMWRATQDEGLAFCSDKIRPGSWALACDYMLDASTLGGLLRRGSRIFDYISPSALGLKLEVHDDIAQLSLRCDNKHRDPDQFMTSFWAVVWHRFSCWVVDEAIPLRTVHFTHACPENTQFHNMLFACELCFDAPSYGLEFPARYLSSPLLRSKVELQQWLQDSPADLMEVPGIDSGLLRKIRAELITDLRNLERFSSFDNMCARLHMSPQVVRRRLRVEGSSYQRLKDGIRCDEAKKLLASPETSIADIAEKIGFAEPAAFSRAFKKWTGQSPADYREQMHN